MLYIALAHTQCPNTQQIRGILRAWIPPWWIPPSGIPLMGILPLGMPTYCEISEYRERWRASFSQNIYPSDHMSTPPSSWEVRGFPIVISPPCRFPMGLLGGIPMEFPHGTSRGPMSRGTSSKLTHFCFLHIFT